MSSTVQTTTLLPLLSGMIGILGFAEREEQRDATHDWNYVLDNIKSLLVAISEKGVAYDGDDSRSRSFVMSLVSVIASIAQSSQNRYLLAIVC